MSQYTEQADKFMTDHNLEFRVVHVGNDCPPYCEDHKKLVGMDQLDKWPRQTHIHGHHYHITISAKDRRGHFTVDFWNSYADEDHNNAISRRGFNSDEDYYAWLDRRKAALCISNKPIVPTPYDVLACITKNDPGTFEDFCSDFCYDTNSRKAEQVYFAVQKEWSKVRRFLTPEEIEQLQEIA